MKYRLYIKNPATGKTIQTENAKTKRRAKQRARYYRESEEANVIVRKVK